MVVVAVELVFPAEPPLLEGDFVLGTITVTVTLGVFFVIFVAALGRRLAGSGRRLLLLAGRATPGLNDAYSTVPLELGA